MTRTIEIEPHEVGDLTVVLNCELRTVTGEASHALNSVFRKLTGHNHDIYARHWPARCKPPETWYKEEES